jgi:parallel beta-helix repeat protein
LKYVVESAVADLKNVGGGTVNFAAGDFDQGADHFQLNNCRNVTFVGAGMGLTVVRNLTTVAADCEPFSFAGVFGVTIRDMTVSAGGPSRTTSDAIDCDYGNNVLIENVRITASRGRGIIFDGKNTGWDSLNNVVRNCVISGTYSSGIELLASSHDTIEGCTITNVGRYGIQVNKASTSTDQPNKKSNDNIVRNNVIDQAGLDGINVNSGDRNTITGNTVTNSSDDATARDGIRVMSSDSQTADDNVVAYNVCTDNQTVKTQRYGLNIASALCIRTVVGPRNDFTGNRVAAINDLWTGTVYR